MDSCKGFTFLFFFGLHEWTTKKCHVRFLHDSQNFPMKIIIICAHNIFSTVVENVAELENPRLIAVLSHHMYENSSIEL